MISPGRERIGAEEEARLTAGPMHRMVGGVLGGFRERVAIMGNIEQIERRDDRTDMIQIDRSREEEGEDALQVTVSLGM